MAKMDRQLQELQSAKCESAMQRILNNSPGAAACVSDFLLFFSIFPWNLVSLGRATKRIATSSSPGESVRRNNVGTKRAACIDSLMRK